MSVIYGFYFWSVIHAGHRAGDFRSGPLVGTIIALVMVQVVLYISVAIFAPAEAGAPPDERDKLIELRAMRVAYSGLATGVAFACFFGALTPPIVFNTNSLLVLLVTAEILRSACQVVQYRRGD
jgi:predicted membrane protein